MFALHALKRVLGYIWRVLISPFKFWLWCVALDRSNFIAIPICVLTAFGVFGLIGSFLIPATSTPTHSDDENIKKQKLEKVVAECESKGGTYTFIVKHGDSNSSWGCIAAKRIELENKE